MKPVKQNKRKQKSGNGAAPLLLGGPSHPKTTLHVTNLSLTLRHSPHYPTVTRTSLLDTRQRRQI